MPINSPYNFHNENYVRTHTEISKSASNRNRVQLLQFTRWTHLVTVSVDFRKIIKLAIPRLTLSWRGLTFPGLLSRFFGGKIDSTSFLRNFDQFEGYNLRHHSLCRVDVYMEIKMTIRAATRGPNVTSEISKRKLFDIGTVLNY